jgi:phage tail tape-measure protein
MKDQQGVVIIRDSNGTKEIESSPSTKGALAGAPAGGALGSVVPVIGTLFYS